MLDLDIAVNEIELQPLYYDLFQANTLEKGITHPLYLPIYGLNSNTTVDLQSGVQLVWIRSFISTWLAANQGFKT